MTAYYNEIDPFASRWLQNLILEGAIAPGHVDTRSVEDVTPNDLAGYTQCHFFAGIGVWSYALRLAGWPDDEPVWTGSCPCQPFSAAGKGGGAADERHLWPAWFHLIELCKPAVVFGEQVASKDGLGWLDTVHADMERAGYAFGPKDICAAGVGAPHIRQRLYFVGDSGSSRGRRNSGAILGAQGRAERCVRCIADIFEPASAAIELADSSSSTRLEVEREQLARQELATTERGGAPCELADAGHESARRPTRTREEKSRRTFSDVTRRSFWHDCEWVTCTDGKQRPVEPGTFPLAHGAPARVGRLRGYGNAIVAPLAETFIRSYMDLT